MSSDHSVKVAVRIRPLVETEKNRGCQSIVHKTPTQPQVVVNCDVKTTKMFSYNYVFAPEDTQEMIYENAIKTMVLKLFAGYNVTILAYGQTGSGKTHTMGTTFDGNLNDEIGVIPRAIGEIFEKIATMPNDDFTVQCSFVELYQEKLYDLLSKNSRDQSVVDIREIDGKIVIPNLTETSVKTIVETTNCLMQGSSDRAVGATAMNAQSSRSHAIFTITVQKTPKDNPESATIAKFHLVDLAGSERSKKTLTVGEQFKEGVKINQGLLALGNVISALGSEKQNNGHIGYRDSKLTRLLQDSLGGNSMTLMIACVSPADYNCDETIGTLQYADRAKKIKNKPIVNEDPKMAEINRLRAEIQGLRVELLSKSGIGSTVIEKCKKCDDPPTKAQLQHENREMAEKMQIALFEMAQRENVLTEYEETIESLNGKIEDLKQQIVNLDKVNTANMSPEELKCYEEQVHAVTTTIFDLTAHMKERNDCIAQNSKPQHSQSFNGAHGANASIADIAENEKFIKQQTEYQQELREFKQELNVKEILHNKLIENYEKFRSLNDEESVKSKMRECEEIITKMEKEQEELKAALRNKNSSVSVKLAEERRKRVQHLEVQIAEYKKKNKIQAQLLKQHEKDSDQIKKLSTEILEMKQNKVKLIKKMKAETDDFRQWKAEREKELAQLRSKERKMQSEAVKKNLLHEKQRIVLQRKFEESNAANKRLKEALLKVQKNKESKQLPKGASHVRSTSWLNEEIELITSIVDIKQSYERLNEARAELTSRLNKAKRQKPQNQEQIKQINEDLEMHNAQISDLRGKINANDIDSKIKTISDGYQSLPESRSLVKNLLNYIAENRTNFNNYFTQARDYKQAMEEQSKQMEEQKMEMDEQLQQYKRKLEESQNENAEKQSLLLKALASEGSQSSVVELLQQQISKMSAELEQLKASDMSMSRRKRPRVELTTIELDDSVLHIEDSFNDDDEMDPDWQKTPMVRNSKRKTTRSVSMTENDTMMAPKSKPVKKPAKRSKNCCGCKKGCKSGSCGCMVNARLCNESCACAKHKICQNFNENSENETAVDQSSDVSCASNNNDHNKENNGDEIVPCTPPKKKCTGDDIINPYVYSHKKRNPIFTTKDDM